MKKKSTIGILALVLSACLLGACAKEAKDQIFIKDDMYIVLTEKFREDEVSGQTVSYRSNRSVVVLLRDEFSGLEGLDIEATDEAAYAELVIYNNGIESLVEEVDGLTTFSYQKKVKDKDYSYLAVTYKGAQAYYLIQFACETEEFEDLRPLFLKWAKTFKYT